MAGKSVINVLITGDSKPLQKALGAGAESVTKFGKTAALGAGAAVAAVGAAGLAIGGALFKIGSAFDEQSDKIRIGTGATGDDLKALEDSFKNVAKTVPTSLDDAGSAIAGLNTRLGLTGKPLEDLAGQFINLSRITGTDLETNISNLTRTFGDWEIANGDQAESLDKIFRAAQSSGAGIDKLSTSVVQFGAPLRNLGFGFDESLALLAQFDKAGVNTETVFAGMKAGVGKLAKAGEDVPETFRRVVDEIKALGPGSEATGKAIELFGQRAGPDLADAIAGGKFEIDDMLAAISGGTDTINGAATDTADFSEKWQLLKNKVLVGLAPLASKVFDAIGKAMDKIMPYVDGIMDAFSKDGIGGALKYLGDTLVPAAKKKLQELGQALIDWIAPRIGPALEKLAEWARKLGEWVMNVGLPFLLEKLQLLGQALIDWIGPRIGPALQKLGEFIAAAGNWIIDTGLPMLVDKLVELGNALVDWIQPRIVPMLQALGKLLIAILEWIVTKAVPKIAEQAVKLGKALIGWVARLLPEVVEGLTRFIIDLVKKIPGLFMSLIKTAASSGRDMGSALIDGIVEMLSGLGQKASIVGKQLANGIIDFLNKSIIDRINRLLEFEIDFGLFKQTVNAPDIPHIPKLADGGIVTKPTLAVIGEAGPEAVIPLSQVDRGSNTTIDITVNAGMGTNGQEVGRQIVTELVKYQRQNGALPIKVA
jgi:phage-related protein